MFVVSDTSPLQYLYLLGQADLLPAFYQKVAIPQAVYAELQSNSTPASVKEWLSEPPTWLKVVEPQQAIPRTKYLQAGECAAIGLALEKQTLLLVDDLHARQEAITRKLDITGTLGVLILAGERRRLNLRDAFNELREHGFYLSDVLYQDLLAEYGS